MKCNTIINKQRPPMKPRIEKKLSKKLFKFIGNKLGKVWINDEVDWGLVGHQERYRHNSTVSINHVPCVGGGFCCGELKRCETLLGCVKDWLLFDLGEKRVFVDEDGDEHPDTPFLKDKMTGLWIMKQARNRVHHIKP